MKEAAGLSSSFCLIGNFHAGVLPSAAHAFLGTGIATVYLCQYSSPKFGPLFPRKTAPGIELTAFWRGYL